MPNTYFQFKQFRIDQERCAMKVCTDACLQGAYAIAWLKKNWKNTTKSDYRILDIGTGTGLLSLMLAQEFSRTCIDAVENDKETYKQALENIASSPWPERINALYGDIRELDFDEKYDFIICNPPFYDNDLRSPDDIKNQAKHNITLYHSDLIAVIKKYLLPSGAVCIMLPPKQFKKMEQMAMNKNLYPIQMMQVRQSLHSGIFRIIGIFRKENIRWKVEELFIRNQQNEYTGEFKELLKEFYLKF